MPPLAWSDSLADAAQGWVNALMAQQGPLFFCHESFSRTGQGEKIAYNSTVQGGVMAWYSEESLYDNDLQKVIILNPPQGQNFRVWGHYWLFELSRDVVSG